MIVKFNPQLFSCDDEHAKGAAAKIIGEILEDRFLWDIENLDDLLFAEDATFFDDSFVMQFLSGVNREKLIDRMETFLHISNYIVPAQKHYFTTITIGLSEDEIHPVIAYNMLTLPSRLIVENAVNDMRFISGVVRKFTKHKKRSGIFKAIARAIDQHAIEAEQAGGKGQIRARFLDLKQGKYANIYKYKLFALFDSDRNNSTSLDEEITKIIEVFKNRQNVTYENAYFEASDQIRWHMLYKRETENYIPLNVIKANLRLSVGETQKLDGMEKEEYDFAKFSTILALNKSIDVKNDFPNLFFKSFSLEELERRCEHHKVKIELPNGSLEDVSELEQMLICIAKIV